MYGFSLEPIKMQQIAATRELRECNEMTERFGLRLSEPQIQSLVERRFEALRDNGRVEFGEGIIKKLIYEFCDSPYLTQDEYEETLLALQDAFYYFKNESNDKIPDDELIESMKDVLDGEAHGSLSQLCDMSLDDLCRSVRHGARFADENRTLAQDDTNAMDHKDDESMGTDERGGSRFCGGNR